MRKQTTPAIQIVLCSRDHTVINLRTVGLLLRNKAQRNVSTAGDV